jgi:excisionase family DNA binding protein
MRKPPPHKKNGQAVGRRAIHGELLGVREAAQLLGVSEHTVRARIRRNLLPFCRWGSRIVLRRSELLDFLSRLPGVTAEEAMENLEDRQQ